MMISVAAFLTKNREHEKKKRERLTQIQGLIIRWATILEIKFRLS